MRLKASLEGVGRRLTDGEAHGVRVARVACDCDVDCGAECITASAPQRRLGGANMTLSPGHTTNRHRPHPARACRACSSSPGHTTNRHRPHLMTRAPAERGAPGHTTNRHRPHRAALDRARAVAPGHTTNRHRPHPGGGLWRYKLAPGHTTNRHRPHRCFTSVLILQCEPPVAMTDFRSKS